MPLGREVGLGQGNIVLMGTQLPSPKRAQQLPLFGHVCCGQTARRINVPLGMAVGLGPGHIVSDGDPASPPKGGTALPANFWPLSVVAK